MIAETMISERIIRHYSTEGKYIKQVGSDVLFLTADNEIPCPFEYEETDEVPSQDEDPSEYTEAGRILMGVEP